MINALSTATGGMLAASHALDREATKIVKSGADAAEQLTKPAPDAQPAPLEDIIQSVVNLTTIEAQYAANAKVVETVDQLIGETLDILS